MPDSPAHAPMPGAEVLAEPMRSRWSPSVFDPDHRLTADQVAALLEAARWAPSRGNMQPWRLLVAERGTPAHAVLVGHLRRGNATWVPRASVVFLGAAQVAPDETGEGPDQPEYSFHDLGQAAAHLTLQARAMGLQAHQFAGFDKEAVAAALGYPGHVRLLTGIAVGALGDPATATERDRSKQERTRERRPLAEIAYADAWGRPWPGAEPATEPRAEQEPGPGAGGR
ncbi:nitroreductase [Nocardioides sp. GY 10113]|uniref:nitroreductase family protein n=1 Tax=Nocardioides sp. GY 10113 TaxID=2569761 RepID=UPI0010A92102|nr:nitroreductase family protein [Nocardioides sp. GY 10113]TIC89141.1 nitroreductase [Nocardioides sp. GY 10113]